MQTTKWLLYVLRNRLKRCIRLKNNQRSCQRYIRIMYISDRNISVKTKGNKLHNHHVVITHAQPEVIFSSNSIGHGMCIKALGLRPWADKTQHLASIGLIDTCTIIIIKYIAIWSGLRLSDVITFRQSFSARYSATFKLLFAAAIWIGILLFFCFSTKFWECYQLKALLFLLHMMY